MRSGRCGFCNKYIGTTLKEIPEGTIDYGTNFFCNEKCYQNNKKPRIKKKREWFPKSIKGKKMQDFLNWINCYADFDKYEECLDDLYTIGKDKRPNHITDFGRGYHQAVSDIWRRLNPDYRFPKPHKKTERRGEDE